MWPREEHIKFLRIQEFFLNDLFTLREEACFDIFVSFFESNTPVSMNNKIRLAYPTIDSNHLVQIVTFNFLYPMLFWAFITLIAVKMEPFYFERPENGGDKLETFFFLILSPTSLTLTLHTPTSAFL